MTKNVLGGAAVILLSAGIACAQPYPPAPPPPLAPLPGPGPGSTTTTVVPAPDGGYRASTTRHGLDENGNEVTKKDVYKEGVAGSSETHSKTTTGSSGTTTRSTTTHTPE